jgi:transketolase
MTTHTIASDVALDSRSIYLRKLVVRALAGGGRGHVGSSLSPIEIFRVLYDDIVNFKSDKPDWEKRDRCILSKGHGCLSHYALLADKGFFDVAELDHFCRHKALLGGHSEAIVPGVEFSTGALGHGLAIGVGMAIGNRIKSNDVRVYVVMGDGEINEGSVWEAAMSAGNNKLGNLVAMIDYNKIQSYGFTRDVADLEPLADKWTSFGFETYEVDGHDVDALKTVLSTLDHQNEKPKAIICHTVKSKGLHFAENDPKWHHKSKITEEDVVNMMTALEAL